MSAASPYGDVARSGNAGPCGADVLLCAGLDPSGGAGLLADARVIERLGARPCGVVTALTVQSTQGASACHPVDVEILGEQLGAILGDIEVRAVKIGMLGSPQIAETIGKALDMTAAPVVWDPVAAPSRGSFGPSPIVPALGALVRHLTLITPNVSELAQLVGGRGDEVVDLAEAARAGTALATHVRCAVLVKGGHLSGDASIDLLCTVDGVEELAAARIPGGEHVHGTGCALSSAIAAQLALGAPLVDACRAAKAFVAQLIANPARPGRGATAVL